MNFLRSFGTRPFALFPRVAAEEQRRRRGGECAVPSGSPVCAASRFAEPLNRYCARAFASWRRRMPGSGAFLASMVPAHLLLRQQAAHCEEQLPAADHPPMPDQPPVLSPYDLLVFENLQREFKNVITQDNYDGFRLEADRQITPNLQASHSLFLGTVMRDVGYLYQIGANYASSDGTYLAMAKIGLDGMITARAIARCSDSLEVKASGNSFLRFDTRNAYEGGADYMGPGWTASLKGAWQGTWILNAAYTQQVLPSLTLGSELTYIVANGSSIGAVAARYAAGDHIVTCQWSKQPNFKSMDFTMQETDCARVQYVRRVNDRLALATELELTPATKESALRVGWDYMFRHARVQGNIDSAGRIAMQAQDFSGFGVSGCIDYWNNIYRFGFMMHLLPPPPPDGRPGEEEMLM